MYNEYLDGNNRVVELYVVKRSGARVPFNFEKIVTAITKANNAEGILSNRIPEPEIRRIALAIQSNAEKAGRDYSVEEIQDMVENMLMDTGKHEVARSYITYLPSTSGLLGSSIRIIMK